MKKKILAITLLVICLSVIGYSTLAYFTYEGAATNVITAGNLKVELVEMSQQDGQQVPFEDVVGVMPGTDVSKIVTVKNIGNQPAWIRISVETAIELAEGVEGEVDLSLVRCDFNTQDWTLQDGYYYYNQKLAAGAETASLFTKVTFAPEMGNLYQESKAVIGVGVQAVQVANNGATVFEAAGWPEAE